jgi:hypothetical protein
MQRSLAAVAIWLALAAGAAALARHTPSADTELAPSSDVDLGPAADVGLGQEEDIDPGEEPPWGRVTPEHSHSVLKELVSKDAAQDLKKGEMLDDQLNPEAPAAPEPVSEAPQPEPRQQAPPGQEGLCAGIPIYDGPTTGWEDCRTRCVGHCKFWSFWHDSVQHRCKLTMDCDRRERDGRNVSAYRRALDAAGEEEASSQAAWDKGATPLDPEPQQASAPRAAVEANQTACSPQGSARKFAVSPQSGWHNLGKARSFASCANISLSTGYKNLVWNVGSVAKGRCYGFSSDMPDVLEANCEEAYCWLFGTASPACQDQNLMGGTAAAEVDKIIEAEPQATMEGKKVETAGAKLTDSSIEGELQATMESKVETAGAKHNTTLGPQEEQGQVKEKPKGLMQRIKDFFHIR